MWNEDGVVPVPGPLSEGENEAEKVIQYLKNSDEDSEKPDEQHDDAEKDKSEDDQQHKTNSVPFLQDPAAMTQRMNHLNHKVDLNALRGTKGTTKG